MNVRRLGRPLSLLIAGVVATLALSACEYVEIDGIGTRTPDEVHPPQHDLMSFEGCQPDTLNRWQARGEIVNNTDQVVSYEVVVAFDAGDLRLDQRSEWLRDVGPGERAAINRAWWVDEHDRVTGCRVLVINRFG